ncbi:hypothetical protein H7J71_23990 [Mycolicibacterium peregrinum]|uniref:hypothetical protein n=1 Tax=Mycolicibacterium TaxID=1866885 RepID=UPI0006D7D084|nr:MULTISPECIES: hypothetical protein [Mycolicibacterium]MCV7205073.1 hypothetical protein [Mycolicibacterium peregrinum]ODR24881.1 hypothetical protein BHQ19_15265 [Mycolicibacterium porcinum]ORW53940.1 hypothetical protein AWC21_00390 [Mycolicibacterium peregrinum]
MTVTNDQAENATSASGASDDETEAEAAGSEKTEATETAEDPPRLEKTRARISMSLRSLVLTVAIIMLAIAVGVLSWLLISARAELDAKARQAANYERAEQTALDYAVNAAVIDYKDVNGWKAKLVKGTSPELKEKLTKAANSMEQILVPLQWNSEARPLVAKVRSDAGGSYIVDSFVTVLTKTMQAPDGLQSTATYSVTIDSNNDWQISDVGGIDAVVGSR